MRIKNRKNKTLPIGSIFITKWVRVGTVHECYFYNVRDVLPHGKMLCSLVRLTQTGEERAATPLGLKMVKEPSGRIFEPEWSEARLAEYLDNSILKENLNDLVAEGLVIRNPETGKYRLAD